MSGRRWIILTIGTFAALAAVIAGIGYAIDPYGVLRNPTGRRLGIYFSERKAKFLMSKRYVPANFDGLIVGPSSSANWNISTLAGVRMYNESLPGGDAAEEQIEVDQALVRGHFKLALLMISPTMTSTHEVSDGLDTVTTSEAIASIHAFVHEAAYLMIASHHALRKSGVAPNGQVEEPYTKGFNVEPLPHTFFNLDPIAVNQYRALVQSLQREQVKVIYVVPPVYDPLYALNKGAFDGYVKSILHLLPAAPVINFQAPEFAALRSDPHNFIDCYHMDRPGTAQVQAVLEDQIPRVLAR